MIIAEQQRRPRDAAAWDDVARRFGELETLARGESKDIRIVDDAHVIVRMIPSLYSYTHNRSAMVAGTDLARLRAFAVLDRVLRNAGVETALVHAGEDYYVTERLKHGGVDYCPPIEVVVKGRHVGTPKHALYAIDRYPTLDGHRLRANRAHPPYARFDFTNPLTDAAGNRLKDECIPSGLAAFYLDAVAAERTALQAYGVLFAFLSTRGIRLDDICFKIDHTGRRIFGELSPDCMRAVHVGPDGDFFDDEGEDASKDTFRRGASPEEVLERYRRFVALIEGGPVRPPVPAPSAPR